MVPHFRVAFLAALFFCVPCVQAATDFNVPFQELKGAEQVVDAGDFCDVSVTPIKNDAIHLVGFAYEWRVYEAAINMQGELEFRDKKIRRNEKNDSIFFAAGIVSKRFYVELYATYAYAVKDEKSKAIVEVGARTQRLTAIVIVRGMYPPTPPVPVPPIPPVPVPPSPTPSFPDGKFKISKKVYEAAMNKVAAGPNRQKAALALAGSFRGIASAIAAGAMKDTKTILENTTKSNQTALTNAGVAKSEWEVFFRDLQDMTFALYETNQANTAEDWAQAWLEISLAMEAVR